MGLSTIIASLDKSKYEANSYLSLTTKSGNQGALVELLYETPLSFGNFIWLYQHL